MNIIGYGSLMHAGSLSKTIPLRTGIPVIVQGYQRIFNIKPHSLSRYKLRSHPQELAILNVESAQNKRFNALMYEITEEDLEKLKIRERSFYTKEVQVYSYPDGTKVLTSALLFIGKKLVHGERVVENTYLPIIEYLNLSRDGAREVSEEFLALFDETTYLGDGRTVKEYICNTALS